MSKVHSCKEENETLVKVIEENNKYSKLIIEDSNRTIEIIFWHDDTKQYYWVGIPKKEIMTELAYPTDEFWNTSQLKRVLKNKTEATLISQGISIYYQGKENTIDDNKLC